MRIHFVLVTCVMAGELIHLIAAERPAGEWRDVKVTARKVRSQRGCQR